LLQVKCAMRTPTNTIQDNLQMVENTRMRLNLKCKLHEKMINLSQHVEVC
jgi:hypothetical protein